MASAAELEAGAPFVNGQEAIPLQYTLEESSHHQPSTPVQTSNYTAASISDDTIKQKRSKAMDMRFYWHQDLVQQGHFLIYWRPGTERLTTTTPTTIPPAITAECALVFCIQRTHNSNLALSFMPCEGVLIPASADARQTFCDATQIVCLWLDESRTQNFIHAFDKSTSSLAHEVINKVFNTSMAYGLFAPTVNVSTRRTRDLHSMSWSSGKWF
jgi:hypothetical protein